MIAKGGNGICLHVQLSARSAKTRGFMCAREGEGFMGTNPNARFSRPHASPAECARLGSRDDSPHCMVHISRIYYMSSKCAGGGTGGSGRCGARVLAGALFALTSHLP